ncbi:MAG: hypothetical protein ACI9JL_003259 [Paracoccaceae bacterium]|jgi:hypothetical protein
MYDGVCRCGFAKARKAYEECIYPMFVTMIRFALVYLSPFKCNFRRIQGYQNLWNDTLAIYPAPGAGPDRAVAKHAIQPHAPKGAVGIFDKSQFNSMHPKGRSGPVGTVPVKNLALGERHAASDMGTHHPGSRATVSRLLGG